jgi:hypothetical protein
MIQIIQFIFISMLIILFGHFVYQFIKEIFTVPKINIINPTEISDNTSTSPPHPPSIQTNHPVAIAPTLTESNNQQELQQHMNHLINNTNSNNSSNMQDELNNYIKNKIKAN